MALNRNRVVAAAQRFVQKAQYDKAIKEYQRILDEDPKDLRTLLKVGDLHTKIGDKAAAADIFMRIAACYTDEGYLYKAVAVYKQVLKIAPARIEALHNLGNLYFQLGVLPEAVAAFQQLAASYEQLGRTREMCVVYKRVVELDPESIATRVRLAEIYSREGYKEEAIAEFRTVVRKLRDTPRQADFLRVSERLLFHDPDDHALAREVANLYLDKGETKRALAKLQHCFRAEPREPETLALLAVAFRDLGQLTKTVTVLRELARVRGELGDHDKAEAAWRQLLEIEPADEEAARALTSPRPTTTQATQQLAEPYVAGLVAEPPCGTATPKAAGETACEATADDTLVKRLTEADVYEKYGLQEQAVKVLDDLARAFPADEKVARRLADLCNRLGAHTMAALALERLGKALDAGANGRARTIAAEVLAFDSTSAWARSMVRGAAEPSHLGSAAGEQTHELGGAASGPTEIEVDDSALVLEIDAATHGAHERPEKTAVSVVVDTSGSDAQDGDVEFAAVPEPIPVEPAEQLTDAEPPETRPEVQEVLDEVDFFMLQGLLSEATASLAEALARFPGDVALTAKSREMAMVREADDAGQSVKSVVEAAEGIDAPEASVALELGEMARDFGDEADLPAGRQTAETHFDLGIAYRDMALWEDAMAEFGAAAREPRLRTEALVALAECKRLAGDPVAALSTIDNVLAQSDLTPVQRRAAIFERASAFEAMGDVAAAIGGYQVVAVEDPHFRDVEARIERLRHLA